MNPELEGKQPERVTWIAIVLIAGPIGYPDERPTHTPRRPLSDLVHEERF